MACANEKNVMQTLGRLPGCRTNFVRMVSPVLVAMLAFPAFADADKVKDIQVGKELAMKVCSPCHVIPSHPIQEQASRPSGPPFEEIAKGSKATPEALRVFLFSTHSNVSHPGAMPNPGLTEEEVQLICAYLTSLRKAK
jgi:cytochrome c1